MFSNKKDGAARTTPARLLVTIACGLAIVCAMSGSRAYSRHGVRQRWMDDIEQLGARADYAPACSGIGRVPVLGEILRRLSPVSPVELFLDNPATIDAVLEKAAELPTLERIWVDVTVFDLSMSARIKHRLPGMDVGCYTP